MQELTTEQTFANLQRLHEKAVAAVNRIKSLNDDPQPGLFTWNACMASNVNDLRDAAELYKRTVICFTKNV